MQNNTKKLIKNTLVSATVISLSGCSAMGTYIHHRNIEAESKMSKTIFLDPVPAKEKTIYVQVKNTSGQNFKGFRKYVVDDLQSNGWTVVNDVSVPHTAMLQANILQFGKAKTVNSVWASLSGGFGSALAGGLTGVSIAALSGGSTAIIAGSSVAGGGLSWLADQMYSNVIYSAMTDIQVSVKAKGEVSQVTHSALDNGTNTQIKQKYSEKTNWLRYRTRVGSVIQKANLTPDEAREPLEKQLSSEIAGVFS